MKAMRDCARWARSRQATHLKSKRQQIIVAASCGSRDASHYPVREKPMGKIASQLAWPA